MMKYRDNMSEAETAQLLAEVDALNNAYTASEAADEAARLAFERADPRDDDPEDAEMERDAIWEASIEYFNRYIAGDR